MRKNLQSQCVRARMCWSERKRVCVCLLERENDEKTTTRNFREENFLFIFNFHYLHLISLSLFRSLVMYVYTNFLEWKKKEICVEGGGIRNGEDGLYTQLGPFSETTLTFPTYTEHASHLTLFFFPSRIGGKFFIIYKEKKERKFNIGGRERMKKIILRKGSGAWDTSFYRTPRYFSNTTATPPPSPLASDSRTHILFFYVYVRAE